VERALWLLGVPARIVAFEAAAVDARVHTVGDEISESTNAYTHLNALLSAAVTFFIVRHVVLSHDWWPGIPLGITLFYLTWTGHIIGNVVLTGLLWLWLGPEVAATALAMTLADLLLSRSERRNALNRTGLQVTTMQWRRHVRLRSARQARPVTAMVAWRRRRRIALADGGYV
jgi:hypothetical protein